MATTPYDTDLDRNPANFQPLTPLTFLERAAAVHPGPHRRSSTAPCGAPTAISTPAPAGSPRRWRRRGIGRGDTVAVMLPNTPAMLECHYGVPMAGAVLNTLNTRLDPAIIAFSLDHGEAKVLITDREFSKTMRPALAQAQGEAARDRLRRPGVLRARRAAGRDRVRGLPRRGRPGLRLADARRRVGRDRAQLHLRHHRRSQGRRLPPSRRLPPRHGQHRHRRAWASTRSISGRCRCSTATAGASPGRSPSSPAPMSACARCGRRRCTTPSPTTASRISAARRS